GEVGCTHRIGRVRTDVTVYDVALGCLEQLFDLRVQLLLGLLRRLLFLFPIGLCDQPVRRGQHDAAEEHRARCEVERDVVGVLFGEYASHPRSDTAAEETHEVVRRGGDGARHRGNTHHGGGDQCVVHSDEGAADHHTDHHHSGVLHPDGDDGQVDRHQHQRDVDSVGRTDESAYPWCHEHCEDRDEHTPAEEDEAQRVHADLHRVGSVAHDGEEAPVVQQRCDRDSEEATVAQ